MNQVPEKAWLGQHNDYLVDAGNGHRLHRDVISPFLAMQDAAQKDGIDLQLVSSFRDFDRQTAIFNRKWAGQAQLLDTNGDELPFEALSDNEKLHAILTWSALPGGSRHHGALTSMCTTELPCITGGASLILSKANTFLADRAMPFHVG